MSEQAVWRPGDPVWYAPDSADLGLHRDREYAAIVDSKPYQVCGTTVVRLRHLEHAYRRHHGNANSRPPVATTNIRARSVMRRYVDDAWLAHVREALHTQDNRATTLPIFVVEQKRRIYGVSLDYTDSYDWVEVSEGEAVTDEELIAKLEAEHAAGRATDPYELVGYVEVWEHVTSCLTEQGCKDYLHRNAHNLTETRIFVASGYRNEEWAMLRILLMWDRRCATEDPHAHRRVMLMDEAGDHGD